MFKNYFFGLVLLLSYAAIGQQNFMLKGTVSSQEEIPENVFVLNRNTDEIIKLNPKGEFEIRVNQGDKVVVFDANDYFVPNVFNIGSEDENRIRQIELTLKSEELEELVIDAQPTSESLGISGFSDEIPNPHQADLK